ncbi:TIGR02391 family protein [Kitasatospora sp. NPDC006786]|uniref:TIGR02391 family protein n=1 Tax=unclassified Kitasatospora TaxID=2633591 RepID=UPI0034111967
MAWTIPEGIPRPGGDEGFWLLKYAYQQFHGCGEWPTFDEVDRRLYQAGFDTEKAVQQLPLDLVWGVDAGTGIPQQGEQKIQLTVAGVLCVGSELVLITMLRLLQRAIEVERDWWPRYEADLPSLNFDAFAVGCDPEFLDQRTVALAAHVASSEPWASGINLRTLGEWAGAPSTWADPLGGTWELLLDKRVRKYATIDFGDVGAYWKRRQQHLGRPEAVAVAGIPEPLAVTEYQPAPVPVLTLTCALHPAIATVAARRFDAGEYADAVLAAYREVEHRVQQLTGLGDVGRPLMGKALNSPTPRITVTTSSGASLQSEQDGMRDIFAGAMQALRNPRAHGADQLDDPEEAQETLVLASWLMRRLDIAEAAQAAATGTSTNP